MKTILLFITFTLSIFTAHCQDIAGMYANKWMASSGEGIEYVLTLSEEGNFLFNYTRIHRDANADTNVEVKGTWSLDGQLLILNTQDSNEENNKVARGLDFNKARFVNVSPRNPKFNLAKPSLKFYESEVFYAKNMELIKTDSTISAIE